MARTKEPRTKKSSSSPPPPVIPPVSTGRTIVIRGARVHNLKNIDLTLPRNSLIVITGVSGSGKSSLAFDTIYAEGQRRYVESLSAYARQFLERMSKPDVDLISGIAPSIAIEQKTSGRNPRSTVGTATEIYDYLRLLYARIGTTWCLNDGERVQKDSVRTAMDRIRGLENGTRLYIVFPLHDHPGHSLQEEFDNLRTQGFVRVLLGGQLHDLAEPAPEGVRKSDVLVLVDRLVWRADEDTARLTDSLQTAFDAGEGLVIVRQADSDQEFRFSTRFACPWCHTEYVEPEPRLFSFNNPAGACPDCQGFGRTAGIDSRLVIPNDRRTLRDQAIQPWSTPKFSKYYRDMIRFCGDRIDMDTPWRDLPSDHRKLIWEGSKGFVGVKGFFRMVEENKYKMHYRILAARYRGYALCETCEGGRLRRDALAVRVNGTPITDLTRMPLSTLRDFIDTLSLEEHEQNVAGRILDEIRKRLRILNEIGLGYLTLDRLSHTLSGGEAQRISIATSLGSALVGALYVLDEPTIGLHPRDNTRLIGILKNMRDVGNTVIVVEHDAEMMREADVLVDIGPFAGERGGEIVAMGSPAQVMAEKNSLTGQYLSGRLTIPAPTRRRPWTKTLVVKEASHHNLQGMDVTLPLGVLTCITGVSGSGKSTLLYDVVYAGLRKELDGVSDEEIGAFGGFTGIEHVRAVEMVDQSPIGRTPRSNPITYIKAFDSIRDVFASTPAAKHRGYTPGSFSFNVPGGRCDLCEGEGFIKVEMQFMADLYLECESCKGTRYKREILDVHFHGKTIVDVLGMTVSEALAFFEKTPRVANKLRVLDEVGLGYMRLGQPATTLSGGEAQRLKLALHLNASGQDSTLFLFDEPTTGLHPADIRKLLACFQALIEAGHSVMVIEHNLDVIQCADWVVDLGPEGGDGGGRIVAEGPPEAIMRHPDSLTGRYLTEHLAHA